MESTHPPARCWRPSVPSAPGWPRSPTPRASPGLTCPSTWSAPPGSPTFATATTAASTGPPTPAASSTASGSASGAGTCTCREASAGAIPAPSCSRLRPGTPSATRHARPWPSTPTRPRSWPSWARSSTHGQRPQAGSGRRRGSRPFPLTILDANAVLAYLKGEPAAAKVREFLDVPDASLTALGVAEVVDHLVRIVGADEEDATLDVTQLGLVDGIAVDSTIGAAAGRLRARHYHRTSCPVSLADCVAAEVARSRNQSLATADPHLLDVCHREGIAMEVLPGSSGSRWDVNDDLIVRPIERQMGGRPCSLPAISAPSGARQWSPLSTLGQGVKPRSPLLGARRPVHPAWDNAVRDELEHSSERGSRSWVRRVRKKGTQQPLHYVEEAVPTSAVSTCMGP